MRTEALERDYRESLVAALEEAGDITPAEALSERVAALTAEVQRLRGVVEEAAGWLCDAGMGLEAAYLRPDIADPLKVTPPAADTEGKDAD